MNSPDNARRSMSLVVVFISFFVSSVAMGTMNNALPRIAAALNGMQYYSWAAALPALVSAVVILIFGKLSDLYGRRVILLLSLLAMVLGAALSAISQTFLLLVGALCLLGLGFGAIQPLCYSILGDMFGPVERSRWAGLLSLAAGIPSFFSPTLGGWLVDAFSWRYIFWLDLPLALVAGAIALFGLPSMKQGGSHRIDYLGSIHMAVASSALILALSWAGSAFPWGSWQVFGLLSVSLLFWGLFIRAESRAAEPILDLKVLTNRTFITASAAALLSIFGFTSLLVYYPLFLQGVQGATATFSGQVITPFSVFTAFMGLPAGLLLSKTRRYKWMYVSGYALLVLVMIATVRLAAGTPIWWGFVITALAGLGLGMIPTINALVVQVAVPRRLLGVATGGLYFFIMLGKAIAPAVLGSILNASYSRELYLLLPKVHGVPLDAAVLASISDPRILLSAEALSGLENSLGGQGPILIEQLTGVVRAALEAGLRSIFLVSAVAMILSFLLILTIPELKLDDRS